MLRCQKCQTAMNYSDDLTLPQIHIDIMDIGKFFTSQILLQKKKLFLKKKKIDANSTCEQSINVFASILLWWLRPGHLLPSLQECSVSGHRATSLSVSPHSTEHCSGSVSSAARPAASWADSASMLHMHIYFFFYVAGWSEMSPRFYSRSSIAWAQSKSPEFHIEDWRQLLRHTRLPVSGLNPFWRQIWDTKQTPTGEWGEYHPSHTLPQAEAELQSSG